MQGRSAIAALAAAAALVVAPAAQASTSGEKIATLVGGDYINTGNIDPCKYTTQQLQTALRNIPLDLLQYASDLPEAIKAAIEAHAAGACDDKSSAPPVATSTAAPTTSAPTAVPTVASTATTAAVAPTIGEPPGPDTPASVAVADSGTEPALDRAAFSRPDNVAPVPLIGLGVVALLLLASAAFLIALRRLGFGEGRFAPAYHSWREARWRADGVWADFRDWLSLGR